MAADVILNELDVQIVGNVRVSRDTGRAHSILLDSRNGNIVLGGDGGDGDLILTDRRGEATILLTGDHANVSLGGHGHDGDLILKNGDGDLTIHLNGSGGNLHLGGSGTDGDVLLKNDAGDVVIHLNGSGGNLHLGARGHDGDLFLYDHLGEQSIQLNGGTGRMRLGRRGNGGGFHVISDGGEPVIDANAAGRLRCNQLEAGAVSLPDIGDLATKIADLEAGTPSDERLKDHIRQMEDAASVLQKLTGVRFSRKAGKHGEPDDQVGLIAQQVAAVLPEAVTTDSKGDLRVRYEAIVAVLVEVVKEQAQRLDDQSVRLSLLADRVGRMEIRQ